MLRKKILRDIKLYLSQFVTIFLMTLIGVMVYSGIEAYMTGMQETGDRFYRDNNLQDLNVLGEFNYDDLDKVKDIKDVKDAELKLSLSASNGNINYLLNFIESNEISKFYVIDGKPFSKDESGVWLDNFHAIENDLHVGDSITFKYDGYEFKEEIKGLINVPDHLYDTKDESELYPNHKEFGFVYLSIDELNGYIKYKTMRDYNLSESKFNKLKIDYDSKYVFNTIMVDVNSKDNVLSVKDKIESEVKPLGVINIEDTSSYATYQGEIEEGETYVGVFSFIFIFIALLSVITTMSRLVKKQRVQIGTLKALGFKDRKIVMHYISYGFFVSLIASLLGLVVGYYTIGNIFISMEMSFFEAPNGRPIMNNMSYVVAGIVVLSVSLVTYFTVKKSLKEEPASILRNELPSVNGKSLNITTKGIFKKMSFSTKWNIRDMFRNKARTITGIVGVGACCMLMVIALGMLDSMNHFIEIQFDTMFNFQNKIMLNKDYEDKDLENIIDIYGDATSESYLIEVINGDKKDSNNVFINDSKDKINFVNDKDEIIKLDNNNGIYVTYKFRDKYNLKMGDTVKWKLVGNDKIYESKVVGFNKDPQNQNITITREYYGLLGNSYRPDSVYTNKNVKDIKGINIVQNIKSIKDGMNKMLNTSRSMVALIIFFAVLLGVVIIYNLGILSYTEKEYQFATLKVLGFSDKKIRGIFIKQNNIIAVISSILGLPFGFVFLDYIFKNALEESFDIAAYVRPITYVIAFIGTLVVSYIVSLILSRKVNNIDMVSSLKGNE